MTDINILLTQFNECKATLNQLKSEQCECVARSCSNLFCLDNNLTIEQINNFVSTVPSECACCLQYKQCLTTFNDLKLQIAQYVEGLMTNPQ